jgi:hypothetical protein
MEERQLTQLADVRAILLTVRTDAVADRWYLDERVAPVLTNHAGRTADSRLRHAAQHTATASEALRAARNALAEASTLVEQIVPWPTIEPFGESTAQAG